MLLSTLIKKNKEHLDHDHQQVSGTPAVVTASLKMVFQRVCGSDWFRLAMFATYIRDRLNVMMVLKSFI